MISEEFLEILRCPINRGRLLLADEGLLARLNQAIQRGEVQNRAGSPVDQTLDGGLVDEAHQLLYPVSDGIPCLLAEEAILLGQLEGTPPEGV